MNRRSLLKLLGAGVASLAVPDGGGWRFLTQETPTFAPVAAPTAAVMQGPWTMTSLTKAITRRLGELQLESNSRPFLLGLDESKDRMGETVAGFTLTDHAWIELAEPEWTISPSDMKARYVDPAAAALFHRLQRDHAQVFGQLRLPVAVSHAVRMTDRMSGVSVRGLCDYRIATDSYSPFRFDVLYGRAEGLS